MYAYVLEAEHVFIKYYKLNPFEMMKDMTLLDLVSFMNEIEKRTKKEKDNVNKKDFEKALVNLRDILIFLTMGKQGFNLKL